MKEPGAPLRQHESDGADPVRRAETRSGSPSGRWRSVVVVAGVAAAVLILAIRVEWYHRQDLAPDLVVDDAYISFRYARNLVRGEGLVFNPGERVEGITNFLWTVLLAGAMAAGAEPEPAAEVLAAAAALGTLLLLAALGRRLLRGRGAAMATVLPPVLFAALGSQARHVISGMETLLFVFLVLAGFSCLLWRWRHASEAPPEPPGAAVVGGRAALAAGVVFALATMTRPEGAMFTGIGGLFVLLAAGDRSGTARLRVRLRTAALFAGSFLAVYGPYTLWRLSYYGYLLPNTFYAKVAGPRDEVVARGWESLVKLMGQWPVWPLLLAAALALLPIRSVRKQPLWAWLFAIVLATWTSYVLVGGDFIVFFGPRMLMPALPFLLLVAAEGVRRTAAAVPAPRAGAMVLFVVLVLLTFHALVQPWPRRAGRLGGLASMNRTLHEIGAWLVQDDPSGAVLAAPGVGIVPYVTDWPTIDMFGLVDEHISHHAQFDPAMPPAHAKSDPAYVLNRRPDYLISDLTPEGVPHSARLGWVAQRIATEYRLVAHVKRGRGRLAQGRRVIEVDGFRPDLYRRGYVAGIFRRAV